MSFDATAPFARRSFIGTVAAGTIALASSPVNTVSAESFAADDDPWIKALKGKHKQVFDAPVINDGFPLMFALTYMNTMTQHYKLAPSDVSAMVVARHFGVGLAMNDAIWKKYGLGTVLKVTDPATKAPAMRNIFNKSNPGDMMNIEASADKMIARGVVLGACGLAIQVISGMTASMAGVTPDVALKEWMAGVLPGAFVLPSGVLGVAKAQEAGCTYCFAG